MVENTLKGNRFEYDGDLFSLNFQIERTENASKILDSQKTENKPYVGKINWKLIDVGENLWLSWKLNSSGIGRKKKKKFHN